MQKFWPKSRDPENQKLSAKRNSNLGDEIEYRCPNGMKTQDGRTSQMVKCIWHRQSDLMFWWPQDIHACNSKFSTSKNNTVILKVDL